MTHKAFMLHLRSSGWHDVQLIVLYHLALSQGSYATWCNAAKDGGMSALWKKAPPKVKAKAKPKVSAKGKAKSKAKEAEVAAEAADASDVRLPLIIIAAFLSLW